MLENRDLRVISYSVEISLSQILREIKFGDFDASKSTILTILAALNLECLGLSDISTFCKKAKSLYARCPFKIVMVHE